MAEEAAAGYLEGHLDAVREHLVSLVAAVPGLPAELGRMQAEILLEWQARGPGTVLALIVGFVLLGLALEGVFRYSVPGLQVRDETVAGRVRSIALRFAVDLGGVAAFALGSVAVFLAFDWPPHTRQAVVGFLAALILLRLVGVASRTLYSPGDARLRMLPAEDAAAAFRHRRILLFTGWLAFGWMFVRWLAGFGMHLASLQIVSYLLGLGLLAIAVESVWRRSHAAVGALALVWVLWVAQARGLFWLAVVATLLPEVLRQAQAGVDHALRPAGAAAAGTRSVLAAALGRGLRALAIIGAASLLVQAFGLSVDQLAAGDTLWPRLLRGAVHALAIVLVADVIWMVFAAVVDQKLAAVQAGPQGQSEEDHRAARLRTLLPIVRGVVAVVLIVMVVLMSLSALGIEVGPLLAGAGVVGVAVGFGAQTLVRDLFSKFFYLLDDAFRVGEYVESGSYKGTVEHLGARSIRLRHHRGPIFTIPYGQLGAVKNSSRDWVIDKMTLGVTYDSDLEKAKKLIKKIGLELAQDPEFAPKILEPLKMQGVEQFGDYAIQIRIKMKTRPNEQFGIRRRAYAMIKKAFAENGIHFAFPTVQIAGGGESAAASAAVARQALELGKPQGG